MLRVKKMVIAAPATSIDTLSLVRGSVSIPGIPESTYHIDYAYALLFWNDSYPQDSITIFYRVLPFKWNTAVQLRDSTEKKGVARKTFDPFRSDFNTRPEDPIFEGGLSRTGSISRGISVGNNQDLSVNSSLNLQMNGNLTEQVKIEASITDQNIPIQPDGNTRQLQDFDQVFIRFYDDKNSLTAGDFWIKNQPGYFMQYYKRAQGLTYSFAESDSAGWSVEASGAISKGKWARNVVQGIEGNQGPYRLRGQQNEPFIIVLAGTERVFIDGKLLTRGQEYDYTIDYNAAEIRFTPKNQITKDRRITVEFQYSDKNYARSLVQASATYKGKNYKAWAHVFSEQDGKNQPLLQELNELDREVLALAGDQNPLTSSIDSIGFSSSYVMYKQVDTTVNALTYQILVHSYSPDSAYFRAVFTNVGANQGNYVLKEFIPVGKVYRWVAPVNGVPQGQYEPVRVLVAPNKNQMFTTGFEWKNGKKQRVFAEAAISQEDRNTFSNLDNGNNTGFAVRLDASTRLGRVHPDKKTVREVGVTSEHLHRHFKAIERFRSVEFERDWNLLNMPLTYDQTAAEGYIVLSAPKLYRFRAAGGGLWMPGMYEAYKQSLESNGLYKGFKWNVRGSVLSAETQIQNSLFVRHLTNLSQSVGKFKVSFNDEHEFNRQLDPQDNLLIQSYQFYDWQGGVDIGDTTAISGGAYYRERYEQRPANDALNRATYARHYGGRFGVQIKREHQLNINASYRELNVIDTTLIGKLPEQSITGRIEYRGRLKKGAVSWFSFYEAGSGLELKREFQYLEVLPGQGVYAWIDYNENGIQELNEFEIAAFTDQARFIRVFVPSDEYVQVFNNALSQTLSLLPSAIWKSGKNLKGFLSRFQNQSSLRIDRKVTNLEGFELYNPIALNVNDTSLISVSASARNTLFFNRLSQIFGMEWTIQQNSAKILLSNGFDARKTSTNQLNTRLNLTQKLTLRNESTIGRKESYAGYVSGRNFNIAYYDTRLDFSIQPNNVFRLSFNGRRADKRNTLTTEQERAEIWDVGTEIRYNQASKGSYEGSFKMVFIDFTGVSSSPLGFEMLEALQPGVNFTWSAGIQRAVSKTLQLSINYNGRKSQNSPVIHNGGIQMRAFF